MGTNRKKHRRADQRACRPDLDGRLEPRALLSVGSAWIAGTSSRNHETPSDLASPALGLHRTLTGPTEGGTLHTLQAPVIHPTPVFIHPPRTLVEAGGKGVRILDGNSSAFDVRLAGPGTIKAKPTSDGRFELTVYGTNSQTELSINPVQPSPKARNAHTFDPAYGVGGEILDIAKIEVKTDNIGSILGYRTVNLSGPIILHNDTPVDHMAFNQLLPGAFIQTAGDLNTLDVFSNADLSGAGTGIKVGRDLNLLNVGGNLTIENGAVITAARDIGATSQPPKGTGTGSNLQVVSPPPLPSTIQTFLVSGLIQGDLTVAPGSVLKAGRNIDLPIFVLGTVSPAPPTPLISPSTTPNGFSSVILGPIFTPV